MKNKIKYSLGTILMASLSYYSLCHSEKYNILIPIMFGVLAIIGISFLITEKK
jgi:hypothetical protein